MEKLFTKSELNAIEHEAKSNLNYYLGTHVVSGEATSTSIITISEGRQLIFTEGNDHTGYQHFSDRHNKYSFKNYWVKVNEENFRLDDPSKFHPKMMPIIDYIKIADAIYLPENKNITKNNYPDQFDKYTGTYTYENNPAEKYHLLTYKGTKIVHTLFPDKKRHNRKSKVKIGKGTVTTTLKFPIGHNDLVVPYENSKGLTSYSILIRKYYEEQIERGFIQKHDDLGAPGDAFLIYERKFEGFERFERDDMNVYQYGNLEGFERIITQINNQYKDGVWIGEES